MIRNNYRDNDKLMIIRRGENENLRKLTLKYLKKMEQEEEKMRNRGKRG